MKPLSSEEILDAERYASVREAYRARILEHKRTRRVTVGDKVSLVFEDRETVRYQIQEMARVEGLRDAAALQHEIDVYNELVPGAGELSATLFIEIPELNLVRSELDRLLGIDECVWLVLGDDDDETRVRASFDARQLEEDRISAVHYLRFGLSPAEIHRFASSERLRLRIDHAAYRHETELCEETRTSLLRDLRDEPVQLLDATTDPERPLPQDEPLFTSGRVRAYRPAKPLAREHVVIEPIESGTSLLSADPDLLVELMQAIQRVASEITRRHARCRVVTDVVPSEDSGLRVHVFSA
jgi:hypothetical protein